MHRDWSSGYPGRLETQRTRAVVRTKRNCGTRPDLNFRFACDPLTRQFDLLAFATREHAQRLTQGQVIEGRVARGLNLTPFSCSLGRRESRLFLGHEVAWGAFQYSF
jgi:hypothetical protein